MNLVLLGPPGAGKGTQAKLICERYELIHLSTGDLLRAEITKGGDLGIKLEEIINAGKLVSNEIIIEVIKKFINSNKKKKGYLFDGFPRNIEQAELLHTLLKSINQVIKCVLLIDVSNDILKQRILSRREKEGRSDDNEETLLNRLNTYITETTPLINYYEQIDLLKKIVGEGEISHINQRINDAVEEI